MDYSNDIYKVKITTSQGTMFKTLFSLISTHMSEVDICCDSEKIIICYCEKAIIRIVAELNNNNRGFSEFYVEEPVKIGVNVTDIVKILKTISSKDSVTMYLEKQLKEESIGNFGFIINSNSISTNFGSKIIDTNMDPFESEDEDYSCTIRMSSSVLHTIITNLKVSDADIINIIYNKGELSFSAGGGTKALIISKCKSIEEEEDSNGNMPSNNKKIISIYVKLHKLLDIVKNTSLSQFVTLHLDNDKIFILEYSIASLGKIIIGMSPVIKMD